MSLWPAGHLATTAYEPYVFTCGGRLVTATATNTTSRQLRKSIAANAGSARQRNGSFPLVEDVMLEQDDERREDADERRRERDARTVRHACGEVGSGRGARALAAVVEHRVEAGDGAEQSEQLADAGGEPQVA